MFIDFNFNFDTNLKKIPAPKCFILTPSHQPDFIPECDICDISTFEMQDVFQSYCKPSTNIRSNWSRHGNIGRQNSRKKPSHIHFSLNSLSIIGFQNRKSPDLHLIEALVAVVSPRVMYY